MRIPVYILIVAAMVTLVDLAMNAWMHELYKVLGLFIPLIVSNCLPLARLEAFAAKEPVLPSLMDGIFMGLGFTLALTAIGAVREIIGSGTLFADASLLLGPAFKFMELRLLPAEHGRPDDDPAARAASWSPACWSSASACSICAPARQSRWPAPTPRREESRMKIGIVYASPPAKSGSLSTCPTAPRSRTPSSAPASSSSFPRSIWKRRRSAIFGKLTTLDAALEDGDRVEIYRPMTADPKMVKQRGKSEGDAPKTEH